MLKHINIKRFRKFQNLYLEIPSRLTLISGSNGIGKSTLLGIIANGSGTKNFKTLSNKDFHPEFKDYFILSKDEHKDSRKSEDYYEVTLSYKYKGVDIYKRLRTSHPNASQPKLVPRTVRYDGTQKDELSKEIEEKTGITASGRIPLPTYLVSTSRLFPFGESESTNENLTKITSRKNIHNQEKILKSYIEMYNYVLPRSISEDTNVLFETQKPKIKYSGFYVQPKNSSILTQSVGQDSLSGIINALLSFMNISEEANYLGGVLCIDELDLSLHPDAQLRLLKLLRDQAEKLNLQIIFTSHSLTIIKEMLKLEQKDSNKYSVFYFRNNLKPFFYRNENTYASIKSDLFSQVHYAIPKVKVYVEDDEAKFFLEQILKIYNNDNPQETNFVNNCEIISSQIGCDVLINLPSKDTYFTDTVIILDGDAKYKKQPSLAKFLEEEPYGFNPRSNTPKNVIYLPDNFSPESAIFRALYKIAKDEDNHYSFWSSIESNYNLGGNYYPQPILDELENMIELDHLDRTELKKWFKSHQSFFEQSGIIEYYYKEYKKEDEINSFGAAFNKLIRNKLSQIKSKGF